MTPRSTDGSSCHRSLASDSWNGRLYVAARLRLSPQGSAPAGERSVQPDRTRKPPHPGAAHWMSLRRRLPPITAIPDTGCDGMP